ncbi:MAG TPA: TIGR00375 family protein [Methanothrix sp.]|nr:TIGR00375 family protein [Methanothrix sp.]HRW82351.1 TIGR00375 family protein [Methanothrix sp.]
MKVNLDLHIHSRYSAATSSKMDLATIAKEAGKKGIGVVATGDCLHSRWMAEVRELPEEEGLFWLEETAFVLTVEVEDSAKVHHLIIVPDLSKATELREAFLGRGASLDSDGRPTLRMTPPEIADIALEAGCLIGPGHAFTPWTGMYAHYPSLGDCYQDRADQIIYVELGLSADSDYADRIAELRERTFLTNSDAHSPWPNKLGREFNQMEMKDISFEDLRRAIAREGGCRPTLNVGFWPDEGKYNRTACTRCYTHYSPQEMTDRRGRCECGGLIKLGVKDRVEMLADGPDPVHPDHRPPYLHLIPLAEIIAMALGVKSVYSAKVQKVWNELVRGRSEIEVLVEADLSELSAEDRVVEAIQAFRSGEVMVKPGGGGRYGSVSLREEHVEKKADDQRSLFDF